MKCVSAVYFYNLNLKIRWRQFIENQSADHRQKEKADPKPALLFNRFLC
jgi:hypothetical protein